MAWRSVFLLAVHISSAFTADICFLPNGTQWTLDVPCDRSAPVTFCCLSQDACLSNGLCRMEVDSDSGNHYARGTCTDPTWASPACPNFCLTNQDRATNLSAYDFKNGGVDVFQCGSEGYGVDADFCCESKYGERSACCTATTTTFHRDAATIGSLTYFGSVTTTAATATATAITIPVTPTATSNPAAADNPITVPAKDNSGPKIGGAVGGSIGGCLLVAAVILLYRRWIKQKNAKMQSSFQELDEFEARDRKVTYAYASAQLDAPVVPVELPPYGDAHELPAQERSR